MNTPYEIWFQSAQEKDVKIWMWQSKTSADPEGGQGVRTPTGKSQVIWVSIGNKQLDTPPPPWKKLDPPGKCWTPSGTLKNDRFLWNWPFDFCKISWGLKKKNIVRAFFCQTDLDPPDENSWIRACKMSCLGWNVKSQFDLRYLY